MELAAHLCWTSIVDEDAFKVLLMKFVNDPVDHHFVNSRVQGLCSGSVQFNLLNTI